jgi:hypothetical protein
VGTSSELMMVSWVAVRTGSLLATHTTSQPAASRKPLGTIRTRFMRTKKTSTK